jgi:PAS domain S-box-containing protein
MSEYEHLTKAELIDELLSARDRIDQLNVLVDRDISTRRGAERARGHEDRLQQVLATIATEFITIPPAEIDDGIQRAIETIGEFVDADRSYVITFDFQAQTIRNTHEWCRDGIEPQISNLTDVPIEPYQWAVNQLVDLGGVHIPSVANLPRESGGAREEFEAAGIRSLLLVPLVSEGKCVGTVGFDFVTRERSCSENETRLLRLAGATLSNALDRKQAEEALRRSDDHYKNFFHNALVGLFRTRLSDGLLLETNSKALEVLGLGQDDVIRKMTATDLYRDPRRREELLALLERDGEAHDFEVDLVLPGGADVKASISVRACLDEGYMEGAIVDITKRKRVEEELRESVASLRAVFRAAPTGIGMVVNRVLRQANERLCEMLGYTADELIDQSARMLYDTEKEFEFVGHEKYEQIRNEGTGSVETQWVRKDGSIIDVLLGSTPLDLADLSKGVTFTALDITERKQAEQERLEMETKILQAQKLESLGVLAGGIAHDFNNLLVGILGNAGLALMEMSPEAPARESIRNIEIAARRAADLARQMLAYSGKGRFIVKNLELQGLVQEMLHLLKTSISKKAVIRLDFARSVPPIEADATQIRQVAMNLVINASEAIGNRSGVISIRTGAMDCDRAFLDATYLDDDLPAGMYSYLEISDTGCGMDASTVSRIFEPFYTTKFTGRGLGLAAVVGIVRGHGGAIKVSSEPGKGTIFKVVFPAVSGEARAEDTTSTDHTDGELDGRTVLLVDDEETVRAVGRRMLEWLGMKVVTADDGRQALALFTKEPDRYDCILLDLTMPHMDGEETFREVRRVREDVCVVLSSGYSEQDLISRFAGKGLDGFIQKPYDADKLRQVLHAALRPDPES